MTIPPPNYAPRSRQDGLRSQRHRDFVKHRLCLLWERKECEGPIDFAHCRDVAPRGHGGGKPGDEWGAPLCRHRHHRESEKRETDWGKENGIDVRRACAEMALASPDREIKAAMIAHIEAHPEWGYEDLLPKQKPPSPSSAPMVS